MVRKTKSMVAATAMIISFAATMVSLGATGYVSDGQGWKYYYGDGIIDNLINTDWVQTQNGWQFIEEGTPITNTSCIINEKLYLFDDNGYAKTGWVYGGYNSKNPITGEYKIFQPGQQEWYYFLPDGSGATGWQQIENVWYYFGPDSIMYTSKTTPDGYFVDANGACTSEGQEFAREFDEAHARWVADEAKTPEERVQEVIDLTNEEREKRGLAPLERNESLMEIAAIRVEELAEEFSHTRPDGTSCISLLSEYGISNRSGAENIVKGIGNAAGAVDSWMKSSGHKQNVLNSQFTEIGVGYNGEIGGWIQIFIGN